MLVTVGRVGRAHGIRGDVVVDLRTDLPTQRFADGSVLTTEPAVAGPLRVAHTRWHSGRLLVRFRDVDDRTAAEGLRGLQLLADVDEDEQPEDAEEFFDRQLVGLSVCTCDGEHIGTVADVVHLPGQDLLGVLRTDGGEALIPFVAEIVPDVDVAAGRVVVDPPPGLLELPGPAEGP